MKKISGLIFLFIPALMGMTAIPDPTQPPGFNASPSSTQAQARQFDLTAIFIYPTYKLAIINGQALKSGDQIGEFTVTTINTNTVELDGPKNSKEVLQVVTDVKQEK